MSLIDEPSPLATRRDPGADGGIDDEAAWLHEMKVAFRDPHRLAARLGLPASWAAETQRVTQAVSTFPLFVPRPFVERMRPGNRADPLLLQVTPQPEELRDHPDFGPDPVQDLDARRDAGVIQKYEGRVLLIATGACAAHCRYCFRRHFPYAEAPHSVAQWDSTLASLGADSSVTEVILSGGDPLTLRDEPFRALIDRLQLRVPRMRRCRIHTRLPVLIPQRVTSQLIDTLTTMTAKPILVVHLNHAQEIDAAVRSVIARLQQAGVMTLNQAVLLHGINDNLEALIELSESLVDAGIVPYYLHQLDKVSGATHFEVAEKRGRQLVTQLREKLPGYAVPRYVRDVPGRASKTWLEVEELV
ncbi:MAG: EF-P beta-lysylation protein EpmB [Planctomycetaceae bacterium]|nr:EF-P beta-lysylation protein EpmB [Planctomycetaceae bacterium]